MSVFAKGVVQQSTKSLPGRLATLETIEEASDLASSGPDDEGSRWRTRELLQIENPVALPTWGWGAGWGVGVGAYND